MSDTTSTDQSPLYRGDAEPPSSPTPYWRRPWPKRVGIAVLGVAILLVGVGIGSSANSNAGALTAARSTNVSLRGQVRALHSQVGTLQGQLTAAQARASNAVAAATAAANAKAAAAYKARQAALSQQAATLKQQQATLAQAQHSVKAQMGELQASQISGDGVYVVGKDIQAGFTTRMEVTILVLMTATSPRLIAPIPATLLIITTSTGLRRLMCRPPMPSRSVAPARGSRSADGTKKQRTGRNRLEPRDLDRPSRRSREPGSETAGPGGGCRLGGM